MKNKNNENNPPNNENAKKKILQFFSSLADETRLKILTSLIDGKKSVNEIYSQVGREKVTLSAVSHQLAKLEDLGFVSSEKNGKRKNFQLSDNFCWCILRDAYSHFNSGKHISCPKCLSMKKKGSLK